MIPARDVADYVAQCLQSILPQLGSSDEVIVVDDGSVDDTRRIVEQTTAGHRSVSLMSAQGVGIGAARNLATQVAKGRYIAFVDADDWLLPGALETWRDCATFSSPDVVMTNVRHFFEDTGEFGQRRVFGDVGSGPIARISQAMRHTAVHGKVWRRDFMLSRAIAFQEGVMWEDLLPTYQTNLLAESAATAQAATYVYRRRNDRGRPSVSQHRHREFSLVSRFRQLEAGARIAAQAELKRRFPRFDWPAAAYQDRLLYDLKELPSESDATRREHALELLRAFLPAHIATIRESVAPEARDIFEAVHRGEDETALRLIAAYPFKSHRPPAINPGTAR